MVKNRQKIRKKSRFFRQKNGYLHELHSEAGGKNEKRKKEVQKSTQNRSKSTKMTHGCTSKIGHPKMDMFLTRFQKSPIS